MTYNFLPKPAPLRLPYSPFKSFNHIRGIQIKNNNTKQLNYPMLLEFNNSQFPFEKCISDGRDIRFIDEDGESLDYWIESWSESNTKIWINVKEIPAYDDRIIWMIYGNLNAISKSNGDSVFDIYDHFLGDTLDAAKWESFGTPTSSLTVTVQDGYVKVRSVSTSSRSVGIKSINDIGSSYRLLMRTKFITLPWGEVYGYYNLAGQIVDSSNFNAVYFSGERWVNTEYIRHLSRVAGNGSPISYQEEDALWHQYLNKKSETSHHKGKQDAESELELTSDIYSGNAPFRILHRHDNYYSTTHETHLDYVAITSKYVYPEPTIVLI